MSIILGRYGEDVWTMETLYKVLVQAVIIFGSETWILTPHMGQTLVGFQHKVAQQLMGKQTRRLPDGVWDYPPPPLGEAIREAGLE